MLARGRSCDSTALPRIARGIVLIPVVALFVGADAHARVGTWTALTGGPSTRHSHASAAGGGKVLVFGGQSGTTVLGDTWQLTGTTWTLIPPGPDDPTARYGAAMVYDSDNDRFVLFGGTDGISTLDTATYVFSGGVWFQQTSVGPARFFHGMAYDNKVDHAVMLWGGVTGAPDNNVWTWDGASWSSFTPTGSLPTPRKNPALAYDSVNQRVILYGGLVPPFSTVDDCWELKTGHWAALNNGCTGGQNRTSHAIAFDPRERSVLLFGGKMGMTYYGDTRLQQGSKFDDIILTNLPPANRADHTLVYDDSVGRFVLVGGQDVGGDRPDTAYALSIAGNPCPDEDCADGLTCVDSVCCTSACDTDCRYCNGQGLYLKLAYDGVCRQSPMGDNPDCQKDPDRACWGACDQKGDCVFDKGPETRCGRPAKCHACNRDTGKCDQIPLNNYDPLCEWPKGKCALASHECRTFTDPMSTMADPEPRLCIGLGVCRPMRWPDCVSFANGPKCPSCALPWCK